MGRVMLGRTPLQGAGESINELAESGTAVTGVDYLRSTRFAAGLVCVALADRWYSWKKKNSYVCVICDYSTQSLRPKTHCRQHIPP